jgi:hypothetical protein
MRNTGKATMAGNSGVQFQLLALGVVLILAALLNGVATRRYGGSR